MLVYMCLLVDASACVCVSVSVCLCVCVCVSPSSTIDKKKKSQHNTAQHSTTDLCPALVDNLDVDNDVALLERHLVAVSGIVVKLCHVLVLLHPHSEKDRSRQKKK